MKIEDILFFDHQATTPVDPRVFSEMEPFYQKEFGNPHSAEHVLGWRASRAVEEAARRVGSLIGADADEIIFTSGATEANNLAMLGVARGMNLGRRNRIMISAIEHKSILEIGRVLGRQDGLTIETIPVNEGGVIDFDFLEKNLDENVLLVSIMAVNNEIGTIQSVEKIGRLVKEKGVVFHCDAAQAPCAIDLDVFSCNIDLLSISGHKIYGPKGVGALYIRRDLQCQIQPLFYGGGQQNGLRPGTLPVQLCVGLGAAADIMNSPEVQQERDHLCRLRNRFLKSLNSLGYDFELNGPPLDARHPGNINIQFKGFSASEVLATLQPRLAASTGSACTSGITEPSYVLRVIGLNHEEAESSIRFSFGRFSTENNIDEGVFLIETALKKLAI